MVAAKLNALRVLRATGNIPENINFAIKTGAIRDFLDNSVVPYETVAPGAELKTVRDRRCGPGLYAADLLHRDRAGASAKR